MGLDMSCRHGLARGGEDSGVQWGLRDRDGGCGSAGGKGGAGRGVVEARRGSAGSFVGVVSVFALRWEKESQIIGCGKGMAESGSPFRLPGRTEAEPP